MQTLAISSKSKKNILDEDDFTDVARESTLARWSSLIAPLMPSLLLSRETSTILYATPWRGLRSPVLCARSVALHMLCIFEHDMASQMSWLGLGVQAVKSSMHLSPGEIVCWSYSFVFMLATLAGASSLSSSLGLGGLIRYLYAIGAAKSFVCFVYDVVNLAQAGLTRGGVALLRSKARELALASVANWLLPSNVLATHMAICLVFGFCERVLACLVQLQKPALNVIMLARRSVFAATREPSMHSKVSIPPSIDEEHHLLLSDP